MTKANDKVREAFEREFERERGYKPDFNEDVQQYCLSSIQASYSDFASGYQAAARHYAMDGALLDLFETILERKHECELGWKGYLDEFLAYREKVSG